MAVIVVLAIVMALATPVLPYMAQAGEKSFRIEATNVIQATKNAYDLYNLNQIKLYDNNVPSCENGGLLLKN